MKLITSISLGILVFGAGKLLANSASLEGQAFEGAFETVPVGATTAVKFTHKLEFGSDWTVIDNSATWYGKSPNTCTYGLEWKGKAKEQIERVTIICDGHVAKFKVVQEGDEMELQGAHVTLAKAIR